MEPLFLALGLVFVGYGLLGLYGLWQAPGVFGWPIYSNRILIGARPDSPSNRARMLCWILLFGAWMAISSAGVRFLGLVPLAAAVVIGIVIGRRNGRFGGKH